MRKNHLIVVCGLVGSGKTTVTEYIDRKINAVILASDEIRRIIIPRKKYFVWPKKRRLNYSRQERNVIYNTILFTANHLLSYTNVIIDATFDLNRYLNETKAVAHINKSGFTVIECSVDENIIKKRLSKRFESRKDQSMATYYIYKKMKNGYQKINLPHIKLDTGRNWKKEINLIIKKL